VDGRAEPGHDVEREAPEDGVQSPPSITWKLRVSVAGVMSRTGRRPAASGGLDP